MISATARRPSVSTARLFAVNALRRSSQRYFANAIRPAEHAAELPERVQGAGGPADLFGTDRAEHGGNSVPSLDADRKKMAALPAENARERNSLR